jgi:hypothetical protein
LQLLFVHRRLKDGDLYFVDNRSAGGGRTEARFNVHGKAAEFWHARHRPRGTGQLPQRRHAHRGAAGAGAERIGVRRVPPAGRRAGA